METNNLDLTWYPGNEDDGSPTAAERTLPAKWYKKAEELAAGLEGIERKPPAERMALYLATGKEVARVLHTNAWEYGCPSREDLVACVPALGTVGSAVRLMWLADWDRAAHPFILKETAVPMADGKLLTPTHWSWVLRHRSGGDVPVRRDKGVRAELAWVRRESPSGPVLDRVLDLMDAGDERAEERVQEFIEKVQRALDSW